VDLLHVPLRQGRAGRPPLWLIFTFVICGTLSLHIFVPALPVAAADLGVSASTIQLTLTVYILGLAFGQLFYGPLSDRLGRRPVLLGGLVLYALGSIIAGLAPTAGALIAARVVQALGGCSGLVLGRAVIRDVCEPQEAAGQLAWLNMFMSMGPATASVIGGLLAAYVSWRAIFGLLAGIGVLTLATAIAILPETNPGAGPARGGNLLRVNLRLLRLPEFRVYTVVGACATTSFYAFLTAAPFIFTVTLHQGQAEMSFYFIAPMLGYSVGSLLANRLVRRMGVDGLLQLGLWITVAGAATFFAVVVAGQLSVVAVLASMLVFTIGGGICSPMALSGAMGVLPGVTGAAAGLYGFAQMAYGAFCTWAVGLYGANPALSAGTIMLASLLVSLAAWLLGNRRQA
jgi:DHA1 family bicyclomycin/chloramphenicol resistance-like MFS transporter